MDFPGENDKSDGGTASPVEASAPVSEEPAAAVDELAGAAPETPTTETRIEDLLKHLRRRRFKQEILLSSAAPEETTAAATDSPTPTLQEPPNTLRQ